jgi:putative DNA primase/helicase
MQYYERIAVAFWILHSHAHSAADCSPILTHLSPTPGCGKTQALGVTKRLVPKPLATSNCSVSAIFRCIEAHQPTLLIDEGDTFFSLDQALRGILNSGHTRTAAYVLRKERQFSTWSPKILAAIGRLPLTIMQRSIIIHMRKRKQSEPVERFLDRREYPELEELRRKAARWAADNLTALEQAPEPSFPSNMDDRAVGNWIPLFTIADAIGAEWPRKVREAAQQFKSRSGTTPQVVELLADIRDFFAEKGIDRIWSADLVAALKELDGRPWKEANRGKALTTNYLANQLGEFDIHPDTVRIGIKTKKGYMLDWFRDAFERYLINE